MFQGLPWRLWLKRRRKDLGLTQAGVAEKVAYSLETISNVERGVSIPSPELATMLASVLDVPASQQDDFVRAARTTDKPPQLDKPHLHAAGLPILTLTALVGRAAELGTVANLLLQSKRRFVTITGPAGVGKTRLALEVAQKLTDKYAGGVFWIPLVTVRDRHGTQQAIADALGVKQNGRQPLATLIQAALGSEHTLLVMDNCEQVAGLYAEIRELFAAPGLQILATSRRRLQLRGEQQLALAPLPVAPSAVKLSPDELKAYPATTLFIERAQETVADFVLDASSAVAISQICAALDGLPLALELAARRIRVLPPEQMSKRLHERLRWLVGGSLDLPKHQQTLTAALAWSYDLLSSAQQVFFRSLGIFAGGFTPEAAAKICPIPHQDSPSQLGAISELVECSLVQGASATEGDLRFGMLGIIGEFAMKCLRDNNEEATLHRRHLAYYLSFAVQAAEQRSSQDSELWSGRLYAEQANFRVALDWCLACGCELEAAGRLIVALGWYWETRGYWQEARDWLARILEYAEQLPPPLPDQLSYLAGRFAYLQGHYGAAQQMLERCLTLSRAQQDDVTQLQAQTTLGWIYFSQSEYRQARRVYEQNLQLAQRLNIAAARATALYALGVIEVMLGAGHDATLKLEESLNIWREQKDLRGTARSLNALGIAAQYRDELAPARRYFVKSVALFRKLGDKPGLALSLNNLGYGYLAEGKLDQAAACLEEALALAQELDSVWAESWSLCYLGWLALEQRQPGEAAAFFKASQALSGSKEVIIFSRLGHARLALLADDPATAADELLAAKQLLFRLGIVLAPFEQRLVVAVEHELQERSAALASSDAVTL